MLVSSIKSGNWSRRMVTALMAACLFLGFGSTAMAGGASVNGLTITQAWAGPGSYSRVYVRKKSSWAGLPTSCAKTKIFALLTGDANYNEMYVAVMTALAAGKTIGIYIPDTGDCAGNYVVVNRVAVFK